MGQNLQVIFIFPVYGEVTNINLDLWKLHYKSRFWQRTRCSILGYMTGECTDICVHSGCHAFRRATPKMMSLQPSRPLKIPTPLKRNEKKAVWAWREIPHSFRGFQRKKPWPRCAQRDPIVWFLEICDTYQVDPSWLMTFCFLYNFRHLVIALSTQVLSHQRVRDVCQDPLHLNKVLERAVRAHHSHHRQRARGQKLTGEGIAQTSQTSDTLDCWLGFIWCFDVWSSFSFMYFVKQLCIHDSMCILYTSTVYCIDKTIDFPLPGIDRPVYRLSVHGAGGVFFGVVSLPRRFILFNDNRCFKTS